MVVQVAPNVHAILTELLMRFVFAPLVAKVPHQARHVGLNVPGLFNGFSPFGLNTNLTTMESNSLEVEALNHLLNAWKFPQ